jgi:hypothetical protein
VRAAVASLLVLIMTAPLITKTVLLVNYSVKKDYYTKVFCENKEFPQLKCEGKCRLAKQLKAIDVPSNSQKPEFPELLKTELQPFLPVALVSFLLSNASILRSVLLVSSDDLRCGYPIDMYSPPDNRLIA